MGGSTSSPRVVHVITDAGPHAYFRTLIESGGLDRSTVSVGCVGPAGDLQRDMQSLGVATFALGARSRAEYPVATIRLARLLRRLRPDVVQTHLPDGCLVGLTAGRLARVPVNVMTAHHSHELPFHGRRLVWVDRLCAGPLADHIIAPSQQVADTLMRYARVAAAKIDVVHHGFDLERLNPDGVDGQAVRSELGLDGKLVFGAIGRIYWLKNYPALVTAFASVASQVPEAVLVIVGAGDSRGLQILANGRGIGDRLVLPGVRADIPRLLAAFDVFVHPAIAESFGMVIIEALAMARPVISTPVGIAPEVLDDGVTGFLTPATNAVSLEHTLRRTLAARASWTKVGTQGRRRVSAFTAAEMASAYSRLYRRWLAGGLWRGNDP